MGFHDRDYYREPSRGLALRPTSVVAILICINIAVWIVQVILIRQGIMERWFACHPADLFQRHWWWQVLTANFLHSPGNFWHLLGNMLFLLFFGRELEDLYGKRNFLTFYLAAGILAILAEAAIGYLQGNRQVAILGASGAVMGVTVLFTLFYPKRKIYLGLLIPIDAWLLCVIYVLLDLSGALGGERGVAHWAHLAGAGCGLLYRYLDPRWETVGPRLRDLLRGLRWRAKRKGRPRLLDPEDGSSRLAPRPEAQSLDAISQRIDGILEKISLNGRESLTPEELEFLLKNSSRYRSGD